jgi:hypothetical protein
VYEFEVFKRIITVLALLQQLYYNILVSSSVLSKPAGYECLDYCSIHYSTLLLSYFPLSVNETVHIPFGEAPSWWYPLMSLAQPCSPESAEHALVEVTNPQQPTQEFCQGLNRPLGWNVGVLM